MKINPLEFPDHRRRDPKRRAEARVYDELAGSDAPGYVLYEVKPRSDAPECDFAVWIEGIGTFGLQVKGGEIRLERGEWFLVTDQGRQKVKESHRGDLGCGDGHPRHHPREARPEVLRSAGRLLP